MAGTSQTVPENLDTVAAFISLCVFIAIWGYLL